MERLKHLISGSRGFIGSQLRSSLEQQGQQVLSLDRDWTHLPYFDKLFYLSAYGNYSYQKDVLETYKVNLTEVIRTLEKSQGFGSMIFVSTSSVLLPVQTPYSLSKSAMERVVRYYSDELGVMAAVVRPSSVTGVGEQEKHLIPTLIRSCLHGEEMPFVGAPVHDYIDVQDFINGMLYVSDNIKQYQGRVFNISSGRGYSNEQVKDMVEKITGKKAKIKRVESLRKYDTKDWVVEDSFPDVKKRPLEETIYNMVQSYES